MNDANKLANYVTALLINMMLESATLIGAATAVGDYAKKVGEHHPDYQMYRKEHIVMLSVIDRRMNEIKDYMDELKALDVDLPDVKGVEFMNKVKELRTKSYSTVMAQIDKEGRKDTMDKILGNIDPNIRL
jgi:hypothetical protein